MRTRLIPALLLSAAVLYGCEGIDFNFTQTNNSTEQEESGENSQEQKEQDEVVDPGVVNETGTGEGDGYTLVWADYFNDKALDNSSWNVEVNGNGGGNNELQYYAAANVTVGDDGFGNGCLILTAKKEESHGKHFTSGRLNSKGKRYFNHGKVESSIMLPKTANGLWPAFWMLGNDIDTNPWPNCGEIDILEMGQANGIKNNTQETYFNGALHWGPYDKNWNHPMYAKSQVNSYSLQDGKYHLYTLIWDEEKISMYLDLDKYPDVKPYFEMSITDTSAENSPGHFFHHDHFIVYDLAIGGNFPAIWDTEGITALADGPRSMYINFVKVYQK